MIRIFVFRFSVNLAALAVAATFLPALGVAQDKSIAGSEQAAEIIENYEGRGALADGSEPTPPEEALKDFRVRDGFEIQLVAAEPEVEQPLALSWDSRGRMWVVQYRQYQFPAGLKIVEYDDHLRARFDKVPLPPPHGEAGDDIISVFEDTNGDGHYDRKKDVITGLNIATSVAVGAGGIWVANPPHLLFYPDADGDDVPDSDPIVKLSGFGIEDTHSVMNSLKWGPDGWLYGVNGSTTTGSVENPATGETVDWQGQMVWRFHPDSEEFEIFAEGGGNTFSLEIDAKGNVLSGTNNGNTRGMFYPQGSYGKKSWGKHGPLTNPYTFGYFHHMEHEGDDRRFAQAFAIYESDLFPPDLKGRIIAPNSLHNVVWTSRLERDDSTYRTVDEENLVETDDRWFRPVFGGVGPEGTFYMADWYDSRLSHVRPIDDWHKTSGRVYRVVPEGSSPAYAEGDLSKRDATELIALFDHPDRLVRRRAMLELGWRGDDSVNEELLEIVDGGEGQRSLEALWALNLLGGLTDRLATKWLPHSDADVRRWVVRLVGDRRTASKELADGLKARGVQETDVQVRVQLAASAKRLPAETAVPVVDGLTTRDEDIEDKHQPLMVWWALEAHAESGRAVIHDWLESRELWERKMFREELAERLMRRYAMAGGAENFESCAFLLEKAPTEELKSVLLESLQSAFEGLPTPELPESLSSALEDYAAGLGDDGLAMRLKNGDASAVPEAQKAIFDTSLPVGGRTELIRRLGEVGGSKVIPTLLKVLALDQASALKRVALQTLARFDEESVAKGILGRYGSTLPAEHGVRSTAERVLASRSSWAALMLDRVDRAAVKARDISPDVVQLMLEHDDPALDERIAKHWPGIAAGSGGVDLARETARIKSVLSEESGSAADGKEIYAARCASCHSLFGEGTNIGPELTGYERNNPDFWIPAIVNPSLELREGYLNYVATMKDGRKVIGLMEERTPRTATLRDLAGEVQLLNLEEVDQLEASPISLMPAGLLAGLSDDELRDLFAYLMKD
ncbi:MAG: PVC-type heme-binding CxxCH protein [Verrucomicrobiales bacterium]